MALAVRPAPDARAAPPATERENGTCLVAGSFPDEAFDKAAALAKKLQSAGLADAAVLDGAAFRNFATDLVVVAGMFADAKEARAAAKRAGRASAGAYAKGCTPVAGGAPPRPLARRPERAPSAAVVLTPFARLPIEMPIACWGWSVKRMTALCTTGFATDNQGVSWSLDFLGHADDWSDVILDQRDRLDGTPQRRLPAEARRAVEAAVAEGTVAGLGAPTARLAPNETFHGWSPRITVRWERKRDHYQPHDLGGWDVWSDRVIIRCNADGTEQEAFSDLGSGGGEVRVFMMSDRAHVLVDMRKDRAEEGEYGPVVDAVLVEKRDGCVLAGGGNRPTWFEASAPRR
jgi:hypothetical protein